MTSMLLEVDVLGRDRIPARTVIGFPSSSSPTKMIRQCVVNSSTPVAGSPDLTWTLIWMLVAPE